MKNGILDPFRGLNEAEAAAVRRAAKLSLAIYAFNGAWPDPLRSPARILAKVQRDWRHGAMLLARTLDVARTQRGKPAMPGARSGKRVAPAATSVDLTARMPDAVLDQALERWVVLHDVGDAHGAPWFVTALEQGAAEVDAAARGERAGCVG